MFTGLISELGTVESVDLGEQGARLTIAAPASASELEPGDSVAVNGVCLTATSVNAGSFDLEISRQTLRSSSLGGLGEGADVNIELPLRPTDRLGGHVVQGHVDGVGTVVDVRDDGFSKVVRIEPDAELLAFIVSRGSIAVDGVSLTVSEVDERAFEVALIPETLARTTLGGVDRSAQVNLETDVLAKYAGKRAVAGSDGERGRDA